MNNTDKIKINKLWQYLKIQNEHLIVRIGQPLADTEQVIVIHRRNGRFNYTHIKLNKTPSDTFISWITNYKQPFVLVQQRNAEGCFFIPDISEWKKDEKSDY